MTVMRARDLNACRFSYKLNNRVSLRFPYRAWTIGPALVPLRARLGYKAGRTGRTIDPQFTSPVGVGLYGGRTWGWSRYFYAEGGENVLRETGKVTLAGLLVLSPETADSASTQSSVDGFRGGKTASLLNVSPGLAVLVNLRGFDVGVIGGLDWAAFGAPGARKWDRNGRPWIGPVVGYQLFK